MNFNTIKTAVAAQFERMQKQSNGHMFRVDIDKDLLWATYLASFPPGTNPVYRERTEHDCSCCRQFVRAVGDVVAVIDGQLESVWSGAYLPTESDNAYNFVLDAMIDLVLSKPIVAPFLHYEPVAGTDRNFEQLGALGNKGKNIQVKAWTHFHVNIDKRFVKPKADISTILSEKRDVLLRSLREITTDAIDTVLELIAQNSLYRGEEHRTTVLQFQTAKREFDALNDDRAQDIFAWTADVSGAVSRFRNTVIGTLLVDLSSGVDLEAAVRSFESKVAPTNYQRPSALITKGMIEKAKATVAELGLASALERRFARISDITINNVLFADRKARRAIAGDVFDEMAGAVSIDVKSLDKVEEVPIDRFVAEILPRAESIDVMFEGRHLGNLVSLIAPVDPTARPLFKWENGFSWSYAGEVADSIKEKVKRAGGSVTGDLCCRLAWHNYDDLDLHMKEPDGYHIYFGNRSQTSPCGGCLDVDMNVTPRTREPVENIFYARHTAMKDGNYRLFVHQYNARNKADVGFEVEINYLGAVYHLAYDKAVRQGEEITIANLRYSKKEGLLVSAELPSTQAARTVWGIPTQTFHRVEAIMESPNFWDGRTVGNRHLFFMLEGCRNDGTARGFFNEFLSTELTKHRKVFEVVASKMKPEPADEQLSGLGFSTTQRNSVICRVRGAFTRTIKVTF